MVRTTGDDNIILATHCGKAIRFNENDVRSMGRVTRGVRGIRLDDDDYVVGMAVERENATLLSVTEKGYGIAPRFRNTECRRAAARAL